MKWGALLLFLLFHAHARIVGNPAWVEALGQGRGAPRSARFSLDAELARPILAEPGWHSGGSSEKIPCFNEGSLRTEAPMSTKLKPQFFLERLALLEALEELFEDAHNNCVDADPFGLCPFL